MKAALCLLAVCLVGYVSANNQYAWQSGKQYTYGVQARLFSGVAISTQYAGLQVKYNIVLTVTGQDTLHLQPQDFHAVELNSHMSGGWRDGELENETPAEIQENLRKILESPMELQMKNGVVDSIKVEGHIPTWGVNIKRAQASYFVVDSTGANVIISGNLNRDTNSVRPDEANQESGFFYETMEETVHGNCETYYTVSQNGPFDWPFQFQKQAQPGQQQNSQEQNGSRQQDSNESQNNANSQQQDDEQNDSDSSEEQNRRHKQYAAFKQLAQRYNSESAEDSHETQQGELPWPKAFNTFCQQQDQVYEIIKSVNFTSCKNKPVLAYSNNIGLSGRAGDNTIGSSLTRALITRYLACGKDRKQFTILKVEQEEQVNYGLRLEENTVAGSIQNLTLLSVTNAQTVQQLKAPKQINDLTYTFDPKEQELQREGKLTHAYYDVMQENESEEDNQSSNHHQYHNHQQQRQQQQQHPGYYSKHRSSTSRYEADQDSSAQESDESSTWRPRQRSPRSVSSNEQQSQESDSSESEESNEQTYKTDAEDRDFLRQPNLSDPPVLPLLVSPLRSAGMKKRVIALMQEVVNDFNNQNEAMAESETLSKIATIARIIRYLKDTEILDLYHQLASKTQTDDDQTSRNVYLDAVAIAGTNPAIKTLVDLIKNGDIVGEQAAQCVMTFPMYVRTPTKNIIREIFSLCEAPAVEKDLQLKTTAILAFSNLLYQANVNLRIKNSRYPVAQYGEFGNEKDVSRVYVPYFQKNVEEYWPKEDTEDNNGHWATTYLAAFGNLGVREIVPTVQRILDDSSSAYLKTKAIFALYRVIVSRQNQNIPLSEIRGVDRNGQDALTDEVVEKEVMPVLVSVAFDKGEHPEVRMAAISLLLHTTNADVTIWQQLAYSTWFPASQEVHSFIYSSLKSLAYLDKDVPAVHYQMQQKARAVLALAKPITPGYTKSRNSFAAGVAEHLQSNYIHQLSYFGSKDSNIPNYIYYKNTVQYGQKAATVAPLQIQAHGHTIQKLASFVLAQYRKNSKNDEANHKDLDQIYQALGIQRREQNDDVEGDLNIKIRDEMQRLWSVNEEVIEQWIKKGKEVGLPKLMAGVPINYQKTIHAAESVFEMPSGLGIPITFNYRMPILVSLRGNVKLVTESGFKDVQLQAELHPIYAFKTHAKISFKVPFTGKKYQAGVQRHFVVEAPFRALVRRAPQGQIVVAFTPSQLSQQQQSAAASGPIPLFTFHQKPYTAIVTDSLWPTSHKEGGEMNIVHAVQTPFKREATFGQKAFGLTFKSEEISEYRAQNERSSGWIKFWQRFHSQACFFQLGWLGGEKVRHVERRLTLDVQNSDTKTIAFIFAAKYQESASAKDLWQDSSSQSSQSSEESASSESAAHSSSQQQDSQEQDNNQSRQSSRRRQHDSSSASGATHSSEDMSNGGFIVAAAIIGKRTPIRPVQSGQQSSSIQKILEKSSGSQSQSTIQYVLQFSKSSGRVYIRAASGDGANEAAKALPQSSQSLQALREAILDSQNTKAQPDSCAEFEGEYDAPTWANRGELVVLRKRLLSEDLSVKVKAELQFGQSCGKMPYEIKAQGKLQRGPKMTEYAQTKSRQAKKCAEDEAKGFHVSPVCLWVAEHQASALNQGDFKIQFTQMPKRVLNTTDDIEDFAKALLYPYVSTDRYHEGAGDKKLQVEFYMTPNKEFVDFHITKPHSKLSFRSVRTNKFLRGVLPLTATQSLANNIRDRAFRSESDPSCSLQSNYINTFDNVTYRFSENAAQNCYHVLAQDCSGRHPISILVKDVAADKKKVVILLSARTKIELTPQESSGRRSSVLASSKFQVDINDQRVEALPRVIRSKDTGKVIARIEQMNEGGIQVFTQYMDVATDAKYVVVYGSNPLRNRTCGLCGDFNGEKLADMKSPKNCPLSSGSLLVASYAMKPQSFDSQEKGSCQIDAKLKKQVQNEEEQCLADPAYLPNNPQMFDNQKNRDLQRVGTDCIQAISSTIRKVVYDVVNNVLKPFVWSSGTRHRYANMVADKVVAQIEKYLKEGSAQRISEGLATVACEAVGLIPLAGFILKKVCSLAKPLIAKGILYGINPICKSTGCCTPSQRNISPEDYQQAIQFTLADEADSAEASDIPYLSAVEASGRDCNRKLELVLSRAHGHLVHTLLQDNLHMSERQRQKRGEKAARKVMEAVKMTLKRGGDLISAINDAIDTVMPTSPRPNFVPITSLVTKTITGEMCKLYKCCADRLPQQH